MRKKLFLIALCVSTGAIAFAQTGRKEAAKKPAPSFIKAQTSGQAQVARDEAKKAREGKKVSNESKSGNALIDPRAKTN